MLDIHMFEMLRLWLLIVVYIYKQIGFQVDKDNFLSNKCKGINFHAVSVFLGIDIHERWLVPQHVVCRIHRLLLKLLVLQELLLYLNVNCRISLHIDYFFKQPPA